MRTPASWLARARRDERGRVVVGGALFLATALVGWDLGSSETVLEVALWASVASASALVLQLQWCAYSDALRFALLPEPIAPRPHLVDALSSALRRSWPAAAGALGLAAGAAIVRPRIGAIALQTTLVAWMSALSIGSAAAGLGGALARRPKGGNARALQQWLSGGWAAPEHAPFFYLPAIALSSVAVVAIALGPRPAFALFLAPLVAVGLVLGSRAFFEVVARVAEHDRMLRTSPQSDEAPVTLAWGAVLPSGARPLHALVLRQVARRTRGEGVLATIGLAGLGLYVVRTMPEPSALAAAAGVALVAWLSRASLASGDEAVLPSWMRTALPIGRRDAILAGWLATAPGPLVVAGLAASGLALAHLGKGALAVGAAGICLPLFGAVARSSWLFALASTVLCLAPMVGATP